MVAAHGGVGRVVLLKYCFQIFNTADEYNHERAGCPNEKQELEEAYAHCYDSIHTALII